MNDPKIKCSAKGVLTIDLSCGSWSCSKDFFKLIEDAIRTLVEDSRGTERTRLRVLHRHDIDYLEKIAIGICRAIMKVDGKEEAGKRAVFG